MGGISGYVSLNKQATDTKSHTPVEFYLQDFQRRRYLQIPMVDTITDYYSEAVIAKCLFMAETKPELSSGKANFDAGLFVGEAVQSWR